MSKFEPVFNQLLQAFEEQSPTTYNNCQIHIAGHYQQEDLLALSPIVSYFNASTSYFNLYASSNLNPMNNTININHNINYTSVCLDLYILELIRIYSFKTVFTITSKLGLPLVLENFEVNRLKTKIKLGNNGTLVPSFRILEKFLSPFSNDSFYDFNLDHQDLEQLKQQTIKILEYWSMDFENQLFEFGKCFDFGLEKCESEFKFNDLIHQLLDFCNHNHINSLTLNDLESKTLTLPKHLLDFALDLIYANNSIAITNLNQFKDPTTVTKLKLSYYSYSLQKVLLKKHNKEFINFLEKQVYAQLFYGLLDFQNLEIFNQILHSPIGEYFRKILNKTDVAQINSITCQNYNLNEYKDSNKLDNKLKLYFVFIPKSKTELLSLLQQIQAQNFISQNQKAELFLIGENEIGIKSVTELVSNYNQVPANCFNASRCRIYHFTNFKLNLSLGLKQKNIAYSFNNITISSLNGVFSDDHLDSATELLLSTYQDLKTPYNQHLNKVVNFKEIHLDDNEQKQYNFLDYGCGAGVITKFLAKLLDQQITLRREQDKTTPQILLNFNLIDIFYPALLSSKYNLLNVKFNQNLNFNLFHQNRLNNSPIKTLVNVKYREIISNPPFHTGKEQTFEITENLVKDASSQLDCRGVLRLVANSHLPYMPILQKYFKFVEIIANQNGFTVYYAKNWK